MNQPSRIRVAKRTRAPAAISPGGTGPALQIRLDTADLPPLSIPSTQDARQTSSSSSSSFDAPDFNLDHFPASTSQGVDVDVDVSMVTDAPSSAPTTSLSSLSLPPDMPNFDFDSIIHSIAMDPINGSGMQLWHVLDSPKLTEPRPPTPPPRKQLRPPTVFGRPDCREQVDICAAMTVDHESKLSFIVNALKEFPSTFSREKEVPFLHRHLYSQDTPDAIFRAYAATTVYANRTPSTQGWAFRLITESANNLLSSHSTRKIDQSPQQQQQQQQQEVQSYDPSVPSLPSTDPHAPGLTTREKLARTQALFLYQLVRCFDGDIGLRAQAERDMPTFQAWLTELESHRDNLDELVLLDQQTLRERPPKSWERWILDECLRRTVVLGHSFASFYEMLRSMGSSSAVQARNPFTQVNRWTVSRHLWESKSSVGFVSAWREKPQVFVENFFVQDLVKFCRPEDIDSLAYFVLSAFYGVDEVDHFMAGKAMA
ncbi:hypothetical protein ACRALDRAFT_2041107 [Sodiomyces alcalophilus JCM 7366]|uniref:uncharacterized protein n=1 Tax=Sodiomyces alcalophilus JCM 7366 TaxID=591952 RepID=UPI0039B63A88